MRHLLGMALLAMTVACGNTAAQAAETELIRPRSAKA